LLLVRTTGRVRYHLDQEKTLTEIAVGCETASIAAYLRQLAQARGLAKHPLNPKLFVEDLLLQYQRVTARS
jgi:DNA polymerase-3 subunit delta'